MLTKYRQEHNHDLDLSIAEAKPYTPRVYAARGRPVHVAPI